MSTTTPTLSRNYTEFLDHTLLPFQEPPAGERCSTCRLDFVESEEQDLQEDLGYETTTQSKILAAALAAAGEDQTRHDVVVRVQNCGHLFHRGCLRSWITGQVSAPLHRRSCPLCKTELIRYGLSARARDLLQQCRKVAQAVRELEVRYEKAFQRLRKLEELEQEIFRVIHDFSNETNNPCKPNKDSLFTSLQDFLHEGEIWDKDQEYLEQLRLGGNSITESIQKWHTHRLARAQETLHAQAKALAPQLEPLRLQLLRLQLTHGALSADVFAACAYTDGQVSFIEQTQFPPAVVDGQWGMLLHTSTQAGSGHEDTMGMLKCIAGFAEGLCDLVAYVGCRADGLEDADGGEQRDRDDADIEDTVGEVVHGQFDEGEFMEGEDVVVGGD